ncbi:chlorhexidine efflux transporter [Stagnihabitans tardus]|nr:chlorhexidine efflux transporter [Stagnihabitans tardus]
MTLRSARDRALQSLLYEAGGLCLSVPLYMAWAEFGAGQSLGLLVALSLAVLLWSGLFSTAFDWAEHRLTDRLSSDRPWGWRLLHAVLLEATSILVTLPLLVLLGGLGWAEALVADLALTLLYATWAWVFHLAYDRFHPLTESTE